MEAPLAPVCSLRRLAEVGRTASRSRPPKGPLILVFRPVAMDFASAVVHDGRPAPLLPGLAHGGAPCAKPPSLLSQSCPATCRTASLISGAPPGPRRAGPPGCIFRWPHLTTALLDGGQRPRWPQGRTPPRHPGGVAAILGDRGQRSTPHTEDPL